MLRQRINSSIIRLEGIGAVICLLLLQVAFCTANVVFKLFFNLSNKLVGSLQQADSVQLDLVRENKLKFGSRKNVLAVLHFEQLAQSRNGQSFLG